jgi:hypothetical protein
MIQVHRAEIDPDYIGTEWRRWCAFWFPHRILARESTARPVGNSAAADCVSSRPCRDRKQPFLPLKFIKDIYRSGTPYSGAFGYIAFWAQKELLFNHRR